MIVVGPFQLKYSILNSDFLTKQGNACSWVHRGLSVFKEEALGHLCLEMMRKSMAGKSMVKV